VELACAAAERVFAGESEFDPETCTREFTLLMADSVIAVIGGRLSQLLASERRASGFTSAWCANRWRWRPARRFAASTGSWLRR
jgi:hypothetical protein